MKPVVIYAGGEGTRLGYDGQKCMIPLNGIPFLHWKIDRLVWRGATEFHILVAHQHLQVRSYFDGYPTPITFYLDDGISKEDAYQQALPLLPVPHWWTYGDTILDVPLSVRPWSYRWRNESYRDAGAGFYVPRRPCLSRWTPERSHHINTPDDLKATHEALDRLSIVR